MNTKELEPTEIQGKLVSTGTFLTDRQYLEKRADSELVKIANETLIPYRLYLQQFLKVHALPILGALTGFILMIIFAIQGCIDAVVWSLAAVMACEALMTVEREYGGNLDYPFSLSPILKMYRARKLFRQVMEELRTEILAGKADITKLKTIFPERVEMIINTRKEDLITRKKNLEEIECERLSLIKKACETNI